MDGAPLASNMSFAWILFSAASIASLLPAGAAAASERSISCRLARASTHSKWKVDSLQMVSTSFADPRRRCVELVEMMRETLEELHSSSAVSTAGRLEFHVWLAEVSTARTIRFEARAWTVSSEGRHLRHLTRALATTADPTRDARDRDRLAPRVARSALKRAIRELVSAIRLSGRDQA
jgi:hypothetical protein